MHVCLIVSLAAMLATGCGSSSKPKTPSTTPTTTLSMPVETVLIRAYFFRHGKVAAAGRQTVHTLGVGNASIGALLAGPIAA